MSRPGGAPSAHGGAHQSRGCAGRLGRGREQWQGPPLAPPLSPPRRRSRPLPSAHKLAQACTSLHTLLLFGHTRSVPLLHCPTHCRNAPLTVVDNGTGYVKAGFAGGESRQADLPLPCWLLATDANLCTTTPNAQTASPASSPAWWGARCRVPPATCPRPPPRGGAATAVPSMWAPSARRTSTSSTSRTLSGVPCVPAGGAVAEGTGEASGQQRAASIRCPRPVCPPPHVPSARVPHARVARLPLVAAAPVQQRHRGELGGHAARVGPHFWGCAEDRTRRCADPPPCRPRPCRRSLPPHALAADPACTARPPELLSQVRTALRCPNADRCRRLPHPADRASAEPN